MKVKIGKTLVGLILVAVCFSIANATYLPSEFSDNGNIVGGNTYHPCGACDGITEPLSCISCTGTFVTCDMDDDGSGNCTEVSGGCSEDDDCDAPNGSC